LELPTIHKFLDEHLSIGFIRPTKSPYRAPILFIKKKDRNAPTAFQQFVNDIFSNLLDVCVIVYLDDLLVYSDDLTLHNERVHEVLQQLQKHGFFTNCKKCSFYVDSIEYLGFLVGPDGL
jgi:hypothetical protein